MIDHHVNLFSDNPVAKFSGSYQRMSLLLAEMTKQVNARGIPRDKYLTFDAVKTLIRVHHVENTRTEQTQAEADQEAVSNASLMRDAGINVVLFKNLIEINPPMAVNRVLVQPSSSWVVANLFHMPLTATYLLGEIAKGPCAHNEERGPSIIKNGHPLLTQYCSGVTNGHFDLDTLVYHFLENDPMLLGPNASGNIAWVDENHIELRLPITSNLLTGSINKERCLITFSNGVVIGR